VEARFAFLLTTRRLLQAVSLIESTLGSKIVREIRLDAVGLVRTAALCAGVCGLSAV
jgi:hypothetical protein